MASLATKTLHTTLAIAVCTAVFSGCSSDTPESDTPEGDTPERNEQAANNSTNNNGAAPTILNADNMDAVIARILDIYTGRDEFVDQLYALPGFSDDRKEIVETVACLNGGLANFSYQEDGSDIEFDACVDGNKTLNGQIRTYNFTSDFIHAENFSVSEGNLLQTLSTDRVRLFPGSWNVENLNYRYQSGETDLNINNATFFWTRAVNSGNAFYMSSEGSFEISATDLVNGETLSSVATALSTTIAPQQVFEQYGTLVDYPTTMSEVFYETGTITITADDGSSIMLNAATGDMATVSVELLIDDATDLATIRNWADWQTNLRTDLVGWVR